MSKIDVDGLFDSLEQLTKLSLHSICLVVGISTSVESCQLINCSLDSSEKAINFAWSSHFSASNVSGCICQVSVQSKRALLPEKPRVTRVFIFEHPSLIDHVLKIKAKAKRRILRLIRVATALCNIEPLKDEISWIPPSNNASVKAPLIVRRSHLPFYRIKLHEVRVLKCPKIRPKQIEDKLLDCNSYQPLDKLIKQLTKLDYSKSEENNVMMCDKRNQRIKIAKMKCQRCNGTISSVRFLTNSTSASGLDTSEARFDSATVPKTESTMSKTKNLPPSKKSMPVSF